MVYIPPRIISDPHPEVVRWEEGQTWPADKPFPLTPMEAWYVMQGYVVQPAGGFTTDQLFEMAGSLEGGGTGEGGVVCLRQT